LSVARLCRAVRQRTLGREFFQTRGLSEVWFVRTRLCQHLGQVRARIDLFPVIAGVASGAWVFCALSKAEPMFVGAQSFASGRGKVSYGK